MPPVALCVLEHLQQRLQRTLLERDRALHHHEQVPGRRHAESAEVIPRHARDRTPEASPLSSVHVRLDRRAPRPPACGTRAPHRREPPAAPAPHAGHRPRGPAPPAPLPACHPTLPSCCSVPAHRGRTVLNPIALFSPAQKNPVAREPYGAASPPTPDPRHARGDAAARLCEASGLSRRSWSPLCEPGPVRFIRLPRLSSSACRTSRSAASLSRCLPCRSCTSSTVVRPRVALSARFDACRGELCSLPRVRVIRACVPDERSVPVSLLPGVGGTGETHC